MTNRAAVCAQKDFFLLQGQFCVRVVVKELTPRLMEAARANHVRRESFKLYLVRVLASFVKMGNTRALSNAKHRALESAASGNT